MRETPQSTQVSNRAILPSQLVPRYRCRCRRRLVWVDAVSARIAVRRVWAGPLARLEECGTLRQADVCSAWVLSAHYGSRVSALPYLDRNRAHAEQGE